MSAEHHQAGSGGVPAGASASAGAGASASASASAGASASASASAGASAASGLKERHKMEGPKNHYLTFMASILLTMLAFAAVIYGGMTKAFLVPFLLLMAAVQVVMQLAYWMHMKDRGHVFPIVGLVFGLVIALSAVVAGVYWMWW